MINRVSKAEQPEFEEEIFNKFVRRSDIEWILNISVLKGKKLSVRRSFEEIAPNVLLGEGQKGEIEVSVVGVDIIKPRKVGGSLIFA